MKTTELVFKQIKKTCDFECYDFGKTEDFFTIGRIHSLYSLNNFIELLALQNEYEVFIETQRIDEIIYYFISGEKKNVRED